MTQLSYVHGASDIPLLGETLGRSFDRTVALWGDRPGLVVRSQGVRWSYAELGARADAFAAGLLALGLQPGDRVGIWSLNNAEWLTTQIATAKAGLILVNINPAYRVSELEFALNKVGVTALVTATAFKTSDYVAMLHEIIPELDSSSTSFCVPIKTFNCASTFWKRARNSGVRWCISAAAMANWAAGSSGVGPGVNKRVL